MPQAERIIRKNMRISQEKLDRARKILGTKTETETVDTALDMIAFRMEALEGVNRIAGSNSMRDLDDWGEGERDSSSTRTCTSPQIATPRRLRR